MPVPTTDIRFRRPLTRRLGVLELGCPGVSSSSEFVLGVGGFLGKSVLDCTPHFTLDVSPLTSLRRGLRALASIIATSNLSSIDMRW